MRDLYSNIKVLPLFVGGTIDADAAAIAIDRAGYQSVAIVLGIGIGGITFTSTNKVEFVATDSDDNSTYTAVTDDDMQGVTGISSGIIKSLIAAHAAQAAYKYGYIGSKRYIKVMADFGGTHAAGTPLFGYAILSDPIKGPVA